MGKMRSVFLWTLLTLLLLLPLGTPLSAIFGYRFILASAQGFAIAIAVIAGLTVLFHIRCAEEGDLFVHLRCLLPPLSVISGFFYILSCHKPLVVICALVTVVCCFFLAITVKKKTSLNIIAICLSLAMLLPMGFMAFIACIFGSLGKDTVVQTVVSPNQAYCAQVIDSDHGATGGATIVRVCQKSTLDATLFRIEKRPKIVYRGQWGVYKTMNIRWKNDRCLIINSREYEVK